MERYYDKTRNRLVYCGYKATAQFWDEHWDVEKLQSTVKGNKNNPFILNYTKKFLKTGRLLEGGCGMGGNVYCLHYNGYTAFGVDFAEKTVTKINKYFPELNVTVGDVRDLKFEDDFFDGHWSLGVIEHFYEGYDSISKEMKRVVKKGGYVFLTFPYMSPLRKFKAKLGLYKNYEDNNCDLKKFYQFALDATAVRDYFEKHGFISKYAKPFDGLKGFKDEVLVMKPVLQKLYDYNGRSCLAHKLRSLLSGLLAIFSAHIILVIFQRRT